jgi:hypothetical protein
VLALSAEKVRESTVRPVVVPGQLSPEHERMLCEGSSISPEVLVARGYYTATRPSEVPEVFSAKQRRRVGLVIPMYSPDGETVSYQLRPNYPISPSQKYENPHGERIIADVHPTMRDKIKDVREPVLFTEGARTADASTSQGMCTVMLTSVWNFAKPGTQCKELLPCLDHVPLKGRLVYVGYDADSRTNPQVQDALERLVARLEERGARVLVVNTPVVNDDPKTGIDDYLAAGGDFDELLRSAKPFEPVNIREERLSKDEKLRREIESLRATWEAMPTTKDSDCTDRSTLGELIKTYELRGKNSTVRASTRTLAQAVRVSDKTVRDSLGRLENKGYLRKAPGPRKKKEAQAYVLLPGGRALSSHNERESQRKKESQAQQEKRDSLSYADSSPCANQTRGSENSSPCAYPARTDDVVPELRATKVVHQWQRIEPPKGGRAKWRVVSSEVVARLGKRRGEVIRIALQAGGWLDIASEVMPRCATPKTRLRDFRRRILAPLRGFRMDMGQPIELGPPIIEVNEAGTHMRLVPQWFENLRIVREAADEFEDERLQAEKIARQRERFHNSEKAGPEAEPTHDMPEREEVRRILRAAVERDQASYIEWQRDKVGVTADVFVHDVLAKLGKIRMALLIGVWKDEGGRPEQITFAVKKLRCEVLRLPNYGNEWFVYPLVVSEPKPESEVITPLSRQRSGRAATPRDQGNLAAVVELPTLKPASPSGQTPVWEPEPVKPPKNEDGIYEHKVGCDCNWCEHEVLPRCARLYAGVGG